MIYTYTDERVNIGVNIMQSPCDFHFYINVYRVELNGIEWYRMLHALLPTKTLVNY